MNDMHFINRDISWLEFNSRVLDEAADLGNPLLERLKFLAIFSSNLDEFFMVRMAAISRSGQPDTGELLAELDSRIRELVERQYTYFRKMILPELAAESLMILRYSDLNAAQQQTANNIFEREILPVLTPVGIDPTHPFPVVPNLSLELLVRLMHPTPGGYHECFAMLEVPSVVPRFIPLETDQSGIVFLLAEDLIAENLHHLFRGCEILECSPFRISRDMDFSIDDESIDDILSEMQIALQKKTKRIVIRLEVAAGMSKKSCAFLKKKLAIGKARTYMIDGPVNLKSLFELVNLRDFPHLSDPPMPPLQPYRIDPNLSMIENIRTRGSLIVHHPYESFDPVIRLLEEAAEDPAVLAIKQTLYRVGGHSPVVNALIKAARNGKQVSVLFEIKARFDEENNIRRARELAEAGAHVVYGIAGLKVHCKALLIVRREETGIRRYVHLSTGNYNDSTARQYTDIGYFTDDPLLAADVAGLFNVITGFSDPPNWNKLIVAPFDLRSRMLHLIDREASLSSASNPGHITIKANAIIDEEIMEHLYRAAGKHVQIDLIIRGICGLNPYALPEKARKNFRIVAILDRFLEHSRIYIFRNNGAPEYFAGSADLMPRNLKRRIELLFPVEQKELRAELDMIVKTALNDKRKGRLLTGPNRYSNTGDGTTDSFEPTRSQYVLYQFYCDRQKRGKRGRKGKLQVYSSAPATTGKGPSS